MFPYPLKQFLRPAGVYQLEYPAHWDQVEQDEGRSCGPGPHDRDDVGLWISILPISADTEKLAEDLPRLVNEVLSKFEAGESCRKATCFYNLGGAGLIGA